MTTTEAFLSALNHERIKIKYAASSIRTWRRRAIREKLSFDFMVEFLNENGYKVKQSMLWHDVDENSYKSSSKSRKEHVDNEVEQNEKDFKSQLNRKLYAVRKQLSAELYSNWYEWSKAEYAKDFTHKGTPLTPVVFSQMTYGRYISKENTSFAIKILKEGKKILTDYHEYIRQEVQSL